MTNRVDFTLDFEVRTVTRHISFNFLTFIFEGMCSFNNISV